MATVREGNKTVLLVVDAQIGVMKSAWDAPRIIENINIAVKKARSLNIPVIWVHHSNDELGYGSPEWELVPELSPAEGETHIHKNFNSSFEQTSLEETLAQFGATHILLAGAATNWCIRATAYGALDRGYDLTLINDAHTTQTIELEDGTKVEAAATVLDLNIAMQWLSYPGRSNSTVLADELDFALSPASLGSLGIDVRNEE